MISPSYFLFLFLCMFFIYKVLQFLLQKILPPPKKNDQVPSLNHSTPISSSGSCIYDVFLSFRGEDTRKTFVDHLYSALKQHQISVYKDDETLARGDAIRPSLFKAIEESQIAVIIFSKNYADSSWCLDELAHIMKGRSERGLTVVPVFYDVEPSEVRNQKGKFGEAFAKQEVKNDVIKAQLWRKALVDVSNIAGWEPKHTANGHEAKVIKEIVGSILDRLFLSNSDDVDEQLVGMTARVQDLKSRIKIGSGGVRMVGIWGVGGGGKTTLAFSLYMQISSYFESHHFAENIREESNKFGLKKLQENILSSLLKDKVELQSIMEGKHKIKNMLCRRNVLIILDDVNDLAQLDALAGSHKWFGRGSRIIVTTRDEHLLRTHKVDEVYPVRLLSNDEAIQLFNRHAHNEKDRVEDYETLSLRVVSYAAGLPLALKVLGSFLYDKENNDEWMGALNKLKDIPDPKVHHILKISFDGLEHYQKELFLDIACFFRGELINDAMEILEACDFHPKIGIKVLRQKALISIVNGTLDMHDLVQEMGHYIIRGEHPKNPEKHSRIWKHEEIENMCLSGAPMIKVNDKTEAIKFVDGESKAGCSPDFCKLLSNMEKLRWVRVESGDGEYNRWPTFISNELRYIDWYGYPTTSFTESSLPMNLVVLKLSSSQKKLWKGCKFLPNLKVLQLKFMDKLLKTPDFGGLSRLQKLTLSYCKELEEIHQSLGNHRSVEYVRIFDCPKLKIFPTISHMEKLEILEIEHCMEILEFPKIHANMKSLVKLSLKRVGIEVLPSTIGTCCTNLISLCLEHCSNFQSINFNFDALKHLKEFKLNGLKELEQTPRQLFKTAFHRFSRTLQKLDLRACRLKDTEVPYDIAKLSNLQELDLSLNYFSQLDFSLSQLTQLKQLNLSGCDQLRKLPELPSSLAILNANNCCSLTTFGGCHKNCEWLCQVSLIQGGIINDGCTLLISMFERKAIQNHSMVLLLQGVDVARGFIPCLRVGDRYRLQLPENWYNDFYGFLMSAVCTGKYNMDYSSCVVIKMKHMIDGTDSHQNVVWEETKTDSDTYTLTWVGYVSFGLLRDTTWWDHRYKALEFEIFSGYHCRAFGVGPVPMKSRIGPAETSTHSSYYTPHKIRGDSRRALTISFM